ncbi:hypothetical protein FSPOR_8628 [Fusarium sporotrichioides]|uniref:Uncharacterized protein n=1 Tax=Fusarium sporotrichioides TaxID=5514 RepID=A0A395RTL8_FUSSP|nr:hypothetical protein FSPOR_8628 [Fusarium sporotrichioides]
MAQPYTEVGQPQVYQEYYSEPRPDNKLPPLDYSKSGHIHLVPGERYCRWRHPVTRILCKNAGRYDSLELRDHYRVDHGSKVAPDDSPLFDGTDDERHQQAMQWYTDMLQGRMPSWHPVPKRDYQNSSSDSTRPRVKPTVQDCDEIQIQQKDDVDEKQIPNVSGNRQASSSEGEKQHLYLKMEDLPLGNEEESDRHSAVRLCTLFNQHQSSMPPRVRSRLLHLLTSGQFQHNTQSVFQPLKHQLSMHMCDEETGEANWISVTYERWFILVGVYGWSVLRERADGIRKAVLMRYGEPLGMDLSFKDSSDNSGSIVRPFLSQLGDEVSIWGPMTRQHDEMIRQHEQTIRMQASVIRKLQAMISAQQKQINKLNAIVGVQSRAGSCEHLEDGDNNVDKDREVSQGLERHNEDPYSTSISATEINASRKRVRRG